MSSIQLLPEHLINQIKAGEVIERPAHLLKELLENSVDADSSKISIRLKNSGLDYLSIKDNGKGIHPDELLEVKPLQVLRVLPRLLVRVRFKIFRLKNILFMVASLLIKI